MADRELTTAEREAARWLVVLDAPNPSKDEIDGFQAWLAADENHKRAYEAVAVTSDRIDAFLARTAANDGAFPTPVRSRSRRLLVAGAALAAAFALLFITGRAFDPFTAANAETFAAAVGHERLVTLSDGTRIEMAPGARMRVIMSSGSRRVRFEEGVALFNVAHDAQKPFVVSTRFGEIRVTGTAFVVRLNENRTIATVLSGRLEARTPTLWQNDQGAPDAIAGANSEIVVTSAHVSVMPLTREGVDRRLIWRERMVALDGQSLREAALEVERFSGAHFAFADAATADTRLSGYIAGDDVSAFLRLLAGNVGVRAQRRPDGSIELARTSHI